MGRSANQTSGHVEGMAYILNTMVANDIKGEFETQLLITLSAVVVSASQFSFHTYAY